ncbi:hypothetical protein ACLOJK_004509 [Asimina triloba]
MVIFSPTIFDALGELLLFYGPLCFMVLLGVFIGWVWKPTWACLDGLDCLGSACTVSGDGMQEPPTPNSNCKAPPSSARTENLVVTNEDLEHLCQLVEEKDGGLTWQQMMNRTLPTMTCQARRRDVKACDSPPQYRVRTVFEDATPEMVRDFFWDDEFRPKWDNMLIHTATIEECPTTGTMIVHWIRKFPFFCSDREYLIGRRIWKAGTTYYCVTKKFSRVHYANSRCSETNVASEEGVPCSPVPRQNKPRRVDLYYSSWCIRPVESRKGDGQLTACEVILFHYEDMGIPREIAKLGVKQGMWSTIKKIEPGLRAFQAARKSGVPPSRCILMAQVYTKMDADQLKSLETTDDSKEVKTLDSHQKQFGGNIPKFLIFCGAVILACSLDRGLSTRALNFRAARRFPMPGRR